jgi:hypothetical protein
MMPRNTLAMGTGSRLGGSAPIAQPRPIAPISSPIAPASPPIAPLAGGSSFGVTDPSNPVAPRIGMAGPSAGPVMGGPGMSRMPSFKHGTDYVAKTGPAKLHKGEAVLNKNDADKLRDAKGSNMASHFDAVSDSLGGDHGKPAKHIKEIRTRKGKGGGFIHEHHHTHPDSHPMEEHTSASDKAMAQHMLQSMGSAAPADGDPTAAAGAAPPDPNAPAGGPPSPAGGPPTASAGPVPGV